MCAISRWLTFACLDPTSRETVCFPLLVVLPVFILSVHCYFDLTCLLFCIYLHIVRPGFLSEILAYLCPFVCMLVSTFVRCCAYSATLTCLELWLSDVLVDLLDYPYYLCEYVASYGPTHSLLRISSFVSIP